MKNIYFVILILLVNQGVIAQTQESSDTDKKTQWWGNIDGFMNQQARLSLSLVNEALQQNPPTVKEPLTRKMALLMIDNVMHEEKAAFHPSVQEFLRKRIETAVEEIKNEKVKNGAIIWKLYNHAFVVKTASVTIGFDIQRGFKGADGSVLSKELIQQVVDVVDVLFVTHVHGDHVDDWVAEQFLAQNKPIVAPDNIWVKSPFYQKILHPERKAKEIQKVVIPAKNITLKIVNYPGHQGDALINNVYLVFTPEGMSFVHTGDQSNLKDFEWIDKVGDDYSVDVVMTNSWSYFPEQRLAKGFRPKLIIPGHENEMGHTIDHREPYWLNYVRLGDPKIFPWVQMAWGEKFHYLSGRK